MLSATARRHRRPVSVVLASTTTAFGLIGLALVSGPAQAAGATRAATVTTSAWAGCAETRTIGYSRQNRPIVACRRGSGAGTPFLAVGEIHGNEPTGRDVIARLRTAAVPFGVTLWLVYTINPDGHAANRRKNAAGVDLNRNWSYGWRTSSPGSSTYGGPHSMSEPETKALAGFIAAVRPRTVVVMHNPLDLVDCAPLRSQEVTKLFARVSRTRQQCVPGLLPGTFTSWFDHSYPGTAFTYEFAALGHNPTARIVRVTSAAVQTAAYRRSLQIVRAVYAAPAAAPLAGGGVDEFIELRNTVPGVTYKLGGYQLRDRTGTTFAFPKIHLAPGASLRVHTGVGRGTASDLYWGRTTPVWDDGRDEVLLRPPGGGALDTCGWATRGTGTVPC